jgi:hypothetical protein
VAALSAAGAREDGLEALAEHAVALARELTGRLEEDHG